MASNCTNMSSSPGVVYRSSVACLHIPDNTATAACQFRKVLNLVMQGALLQVAKGAVQPRILGPSCHRETISGLPCQSSLATLEQSAVGTHGVFSGPAPWPLSLWGDLQLSCKGHYFDSFVCVHPQFLYFTFCFPCCISHNLACQKNIWGSNLAKKSNCKVVQKSVASVFPIPMVEAPLR